MAFPPRSNPVMEKMIKSEKNKQTRETILLEAVDYKQ